ncbi:MAG: adenylate/guanylate cyclase domain-containing protein, partial [Actinobacteria bacterium]|nr:adenylate/guanylate cyclase domain-containing protein [Actinomycetota bacterium]
MGPLPSVVTLLFTDLVGSTALLDRLGDDAAEKIRREHFGVLRRAVADSGGREAKSLGDGLMVSFTSPLDALTCAVAIQRAVRDQNRVVAAGAHSVRVGVHVGEPVQDEDDFH